MYYFFLRHNNDIDNITPIIYKMKTSGYDVKVFHWQCPIFEDYRYDFIRDLGIEIIYCTNIGDTVADKPKALVFDHVGTIRLPKTLRLCKEAGIPTIALPHGMNVYTDNFDTVRRVRKFQGFDYFATVQTLGSARYCSEWMDINEAIYPRKGLVEGYQNVGLALGKVISRETQYIIDNIAKDLPNFSFHIRPDLRASDVPPGVFTSEVISWSDVMLSLTSCTTAENFIKNKPTLHLRYCHSRGVNFEDQCYNIHSYEQLVSSLSVAAEKSPKDTGDWLEEHLYCGKGLGYDVLGAYVNYITEK
jgi:hypothetical protein